MSAESPISPPSHLAALAAVLHEASDSESLVRIFDELAAESLALSEAAPSEELWAFWLRLSESFYGDALAMRVPPKPKKRRWFR
ncbi:hypothetical protein AB0E62_34255 [Streptomyces sp. NPDC038707]|uniref:hypothetical protein n=1 Tax=Streptomyces sp. NPDC038707 TaxID=3154329 RepID=UPI00340FED4B